MKEEQQAEQNVYKNVKKEYENPYKKPVIPADILEGQDDDDDQFYGTKDWEFSFIKSKTEKMKNNPLIYPHGDVNILNNDESNYDGARGEETKFKDPVDDSDYDPEEDGNDQDEDSEEEITWAGDHEEVLPKPNYDVVILEQDSDDHDH